ncbi:MAG: FtsX-like permease family protein, partial [Planctomycetota bacterium]
KNMPDYPGIAESDHCRDWEPGIPIDLDRIRDEDEAYWDDHRGTPKAFIGLDAGTRLWANRFGGLTAIRVQAADLEAALGRCREGLAPASIGLFFQDVRERALASATTATDFGGLFLGLSFFLVVSAFLLIAMLYAIGIESRSGELGTLLATGFRPRAAAGLFLLEGGLVALTGSIVGGGVGIGYTQAVLVGLTTIWRDAVGPTALELAVTPRSVIIGIGCSLLGALATIVVVLRRRTRQPAVLLLRGTDAAYDGRPRGQRRWIVVAILTSLAALGIVLATGADRGPAAAGAFFGAGALLVIAVIAASALILGRLVRSRRPQRSIIELGVSNGARRPLRSIGVIAMLPCGVFLVTAVGANRLDAGADATERSSGTGGFALFATSSIPVPQ